MIQQGWHEQYERMLRSGQRLDAVAAGRIAASSNEARDALFHFFQDAYHLKDWLKNDPALDRSVRNLVEDAVSTSLALRICADLCNGTKHFSLNSTRSGDPSTAFVSQSVIVRPPAAMATVASIGPEGSRLASESTISIDAADVHGPTGYTSHSWEVESQGNTWTAEVLAQLVIKAWQDWLAAKGLLPQP